MKLSNLNSKKYYHATKLENLKSILKHGLKPGISRFASDPKQIHVHYDFEPSGIYLGSFDTATFYACHLEHPIIIEISLSMDSVSHLDEASLAHFYMQQSLKKIDILEIDKLFELYPIDGEFGNWKDISAQVMHNKQEIMKDIALGKLDEFINSENLIRIAIDLDYPVVVKTVDPSDFSKIWKFKSSNAKTWEDPEEMFYNSAKGPNQMDPKFWETLIDK